VLRSVLGKTLRDQRRSLLFWGLGFLAMIFLYVSPYQAFVDQGILDMTGGTIYETIGFDPSPAGYLRGTVFGILGPILLTMAAATYGARAIAGEEEAGTLDLLLAHPVSRARLVLERFAALVTTVLLLGLIIWIALVAATTVAEMDIPLDLLAQAVLGLALVALTFGALALAVGAAVGRRSVVLGVTAALAVLSYIAFTFAPSVDALSFLEPLSPFTWFLQQNPLIDGLDPGGLALLVAVPLVLGALAVPALQRRDVGV
jgi:ABC-2 type transport system permease protein